MTVVDLLARLDQASTRGAGKWAARCPAHEDNSPSLSITEGERGILVKCWAGCTLHKITAALDIRVADLFLDALPAHGQRPKPRPARVDRRALAFRFDLGALDHRLRAERIMRAATGLIASTLNNDELDRSLGAVSIAYHGIERAELFERVADNLRMKDFTERDHEQQRRIA